VKALYLDARFPRDNERLNAKLEANGLRLRKGVWSHHLISSAISAVHPRSTVDYHNFNENMSIPDGYDVYLIGGRGNSKVYNGEEFDEWRRSLVLEVGRHIGEKRFIGFCFGHQVLGQALGMDLCNAGRLRKGVFETTLFGRQLHLLYAHRNVLCGEPNFQRVSVVATPLIDLLKYDGVVRSLGVQSHPEYGATDIGIQVYVALFVQNPELRDRILDQSQAIKSSSKHLLRHGIKFVLGED
jgi:GMP synthase-like glutamine amidotransferase